MSAKAKSRFTPAARPGPAKKSALAGGTGLFARLADLYARMEGAYKDVAARAGLSCANCEQNCCTSFFRHHTRIEWAFLWRGLNALPAQQLKAVLERAREYMRSANMAIAAGAVPTAMCPLNDSGLCSLYAHRLMICRLHGTKNVFTMPDGAMRTFSGCWRFVDLQKAAGDATPFLDRTHFYQELAGLEMEFCRRATAPLPGVNMTLAEMLVLGPPKLL